MSQVKNPAPIAPPGKYLTVLLENGAYGIAVLKVREIIRLQKLTPLPQMPDYVKGVINLRGRVIPIVDLRKRFRLPACMTERTCIVVVQIKLSTGAAVPMGLVVDTVEEVVTLTADQIEPTPEFGNSIDVRYLRGVAKVKDTMSMLLDLDHVLSDQQLEELEAIVPSTI